MGIIYKATNKINGKIYIGQSTRTLNYRKSTHKASIKNKNVTTPFCFALRKYGFDNFEGLQENWYGGYHGKGWFSKNGKLPTINKNVKIIKGWFKDTLPDFFKNHKEKISFMHIDCDTYKSTKDILNNINCNLLQKKFSFFF